MSCPVLRVLPGLLALASLSFQLQAQTPAAAATLPDLQPPPSAREWANAQCVAALEVQTDALALQVKGGRADLRGLLRARLKAGAAFVGDAYLQGQRDEQRSHAVLDRALAVQRTLPKAEQAAQQERCAQEGDRLLAAANPISRAVVGKLADRRMARLLEP